MRKIIIRILIALIVLAGCKPQMDEKPRFPIGSKVEYNGICPGDNCGFKGDGPTDKMPMYVDSAYNAYGYPGHLMYLCHDSSTPVHIMNVIDYDLEVYNPKNKQ